MDVLSDGLGAGVRGAAWTQGLTAGIASYGCSRLRCPALTDGQLAHVRAITRPEHAARLLERATCDRQRRESTGRTTPADLMTTIGRRCASASEDCSMTSGCFSASQAPSHAHRCSPSCQLVSTLQFRYAFSTAMEMQLMPRDGSVEVLVGAGTPLAAYFRPWEISEDVRQFSLISMHAGPSLHAAALTHTIHHTGLAAGGPPTSPSDMMTGSRIVHCMASWSPPPEA